MFSNALTLFLTLVVCFLELGLLLGALLVTLKLDGIRITGSGLFHVVGSFACPDILH